MECDGRRDVKSEMLGACLPLAGEAVAQGQSAK